jgi:L-iditol 2-dehydrogenase
MSQTIEHLGAQHAAPAHSGKMRAGVYRGKGQVVVEHLPIPEIGEGELLFRVAACGICGTDIKKIHHGFVAAPQVLGHELAGTVVKVGRGVTKFKVGDRVVSFHHIPCANCFYCERKLFSQCAGYKKTGLTAGLGDPNGGGFGEYVRAMPWIVERGMIALPHDVSFEEATFVEPVNTCLKAVRKARVAKGETVLVIGQGPIGMLLMILAKYEGAVVYASDPMAGRRAASLRFGAKEVFDPTKQALKKEIRERTGGRGADAVLIAVPSPTLVPEGLAIARPGGRMLLFAHNDPVMQLSFPAATVGVEEKEILGSYSASVDDQAESAALVFERRIPVRELISHRFPLERIAEALELAAHPAEDTLKVVITHA